MAGTNFRLTIAEPTDPTWAGATPSERAAFYREYGRRAIASLRDQLERGLDRFGARMPPRRRPRADRASGPVLIPHDQESRTYKRLRFVLGKGFITVFWSHGWGKILEYHGEGLVIGAPVRDVRGLEPKREEKLHRGMGDWWGKRHRGPTPKPKPVSTPPPTPTVAPPAPAARSEQEARVEARRAQVAARLPGLVAERERLSAERDAAKALYDRFPQGTFTAERSAARSAWLDAERRLRGVETTYNRLVEWEDRIELNPSLVPPGRIAERLADYREGDEVVAKLARIGNEAEQSRLADKALRDYLATLRPGDRRRKEIREEVKRLEAEAKEAQRRYHDRFNTPRSAQRLALVDALGIRSPGRVSADPTGIAAAGLKDQIGHGESFVRSLLDDAEGINHIQIRYVEMAAGGRAHAGGDTAHLSPTTPAQTVAHEIGHILEDQLKGGSIAPVTAGELGKEFLAHRTAGEAAENFDKLFPGTGFRPDERGRKDDFDRFFSPLEAYYAGKEYSNRSEIISMGIEALYSDPGRFAREDPEYAKFMVGLLRGDLR